MSDEKLRDDDVVTPPGGRHPLDGSRRNFTRMGLGAPVLMSMASQPVFGFNCGSNAASGNLSDPDRGDCTKGFSAETIRNTGNYGPRYMSNTKIRETMLAELEHIFPGNQKNKTLIGILNSGTEMQQLAVASMVNASMSMTYILNTEQLMELLRNGTPASNGTLTRRMQRYSNPYYGLTTEDFLRWTMI
jgi:hypothetical protein